MVVNLSRKEVSKRFDVVKLYDDSGFKLAMDTRFLEKGEYFLVAITKDKRGVVRSKKINRKVIID